MKTHKTHPLLNGETVELREDEMHNFSVCILSADQMPMVNFQFGVYEFRARKQFETIRKDDEAKRSAA